MFDRKGEGGTARPGTPPAERAGPTSAELAAREEATARNLVEAEKNLERAARELELAESRHLAAIADPGVSGAPLTALRRDCDAKQQEVESLEREVARARAAQTEVAGLREAAALTGKCAALAAESSAFLRRIEEALRAVPPEWTGYELVFQKGRALNAELERFKRRYPNVTVAVPPAGDSRLTPDLLALAKSVGPALAVLDGLRRERQNPPPKPEPIGPGFLLVGDSPRAVAQREALGRSQPAPARTHGGRQ